MCYLALKGKSKTSCSIWRNYELVRDFMPFLVISKFKQVLKRNEVVFARDNIFSIVSRSGKFSVDNGK